MYVHMYYYPEHHKGATSIAPAIDGQSGNNRNNRNSVDDTSEMVPITAMLGG